MGYIVDNIEPNLTEFEKREKEELIFNTILECYINEKNNRSGYYEVNTYRKPRVN